MRKPEAARLMDWFYAIPPYRWLLPFGGSRTHYEIIGSATTICACGWVDVKTAFLGPNATRLRCILPLNGPSREALVWEGTMPAGVARGMRGLRATPATRHSRRGCTNYYRRRGVVGAPLEHQRSDGFLAPPGLVVLHLPIPHPPWIPRDPPCEGLQTAVRRCTVFQAHAAEISREHPAGKVAAPSTGRTIGGRGGTQERVD
jgi:hypothetical protein